MLKIYIKLVEAGVRTVEQVPDKYREAVKEALGMNLSENDAKE